MPQKLSYEEVEKEFTDKGYKLLDKEYINNSTKMSFSNNEGFIAVMSLSDFKRGNTPMYFSQSNPFVIENIKLFLKNQKDGTHLLSDKFEGNTTPLILKCGKCGETFTRSWTTIQSSNHCLCVKCSHKQTGKNRRKSIEEVQKLFHQHNLKLLEKDYKGITQLLECEDNQGYRGYNSIRNLYRNGKITLFDLKNNAKFFIYNANNYAKINNIDCKVLEISKNQKWSNVGIVCECVCGNKFETSILAFKEGKNKCDECSEKISRYELKVEKWLKLNNINYIKEQRFKNCKDKLPLPFDFYLFDKNIVIEVDGEGHYKPAHFNNCSKENAIKSFKQVVKHDEIKTNYCKNNNIKLIRIPYWEFENDNYKTILTNNIKD